MTCRTYSSAPPSTPTRPDWPLWREPLRGGMICRISLRSWRGTGIAGFAAFVGDADYVAGRSSRWFGRLNVAGARVWVQLWQVDQSSVTSSLAGSARTRYGVRASILPYLGSTVAKQLHVCIIPRILVATMHKPYKITNNSVIPVRSEPLCS